MSVNNLSASEVLEERLSDIAAKRLPDPKLNALKCAGWIAIKAVLRAGLAGNVQCKQAAEEIEPYLQIILKK